MSGDDRCAASGRWFHRIASGSDERYADSDPGDEGDVLLERGDDTFLVTVENVTGEQEGSDGR